MEYLYEQLISMLETIERMAWDGRHEDPRLERLSLDLAGLAEQQAELEGD